MNNIYIGNNTHIRGSVISSNTAVVENEIVINGVELPPCPSKGRNIIVRRLDLAYKSRTKNMLFYERKKAPETWCLFLFSSKSVKTEIRLVESRAPLQI